MYPPSYICIRWVRYIQCILASLFKWMPLGFICVFIIRQTRLVDLFHAPIIFDSIVCNCARWKIWRRYTYHPYCLWAKSWLALWLINKIDGTHAFWTEERCYEDFVIAIFHLIIEMAICKFVVKRELLIRRSFTVLPLHVHKRLISTYLEFISSLFHNNLIEHYLLCLAQKRYFS